MKYMSNSKIAKSGMYITQNSVYIVLGTAGGMQIFKNGQKLFPENVTAYIDDETLVWDENKRTTKIKSFSKIVDKEVLKDGLKELGKRLCEKVPDKEKYINEIEQMIRNKNQALSKINGLPIPECPLYKVYLKEDYEYAAIFLYVSEQLLGFDLSQDRDFNKILSDMCINYYGFAEVIENITLEAYKSL